jgi:hypothetical protein
MENLIQDSMNLFKKNHDLEEKIMIWRGDATVVNAAIRQKDTHKLKYWRQWVVCFMEFDRIVEQIETKEPIIVKRSISEDIYSHLNVNDIIETITYTSTSDPTVDSLYDKSDSFGEYHMEILLPPKTHCFYYSVVDDDDEYFSEHEIILPPGHMCYNGRRNDIHQFTWLNSRQLVPILRENGLIGKDVEYELNYNQINF